MGGLERPHPKFDIGLARLAVRCSSSVYDDLVTHEEFMTYLNQHNLEETNAVSFDPRDPSNFRVRAARTRLIASFHMNEHVNGRLEDSHGAIFQQFEASTDGANSDSSHRSTERLIIAFRGTASTTNVATDIDTTQLVYNVPDG